MESDKPAKNAKLSHLDRSGRVRMVDISDKAGTLRTAKAEGKIILSATALDALTKSEMPKGNVLTTAQIAGIQAAKKTADLIPLCHPLNISWIDITFEIAPDGVVISSEVKSVDSTGLEMEALTAVSVAALTIYDMCKSVDKNMSIGGITLVEKNGGKSTHVADYRPRSSVVIISDSVSAGTAVDRSGQALVDGLTSAGCEVVGSPTVPDNIDDIRGAITRSIADGAELIISTGGTGLGPRDVTITAVEEMLTDRLPGVEQALHAFGRGRVPTAMLSRLIAGVIDETIVVCLPGSTKAVTDALSVLVPAVFHAFEVQRGAGHSSR